jgi:hypothetical protein
MVQPNSAVLVLFYDQAERISSLTPATGAIPMHQAAWEPGQCGSEDRRHEIREFDNG